MLVLSPYACKDADAMNIAITHNFDKNEGIRQVEDLLNDSVQGDSCCSTQCGVHTEASRDNATVVVLDDNCDQAMFETAVEIQLHCKLRNLCFEVISFNCITDQQVEDFLDKTVNKI